MTELNVPYLEDATIERAAHELLRGYATSKGAPIRPPIDIDDIAEHYLGLELAVLNLRELLGQKDVLGGLCLDARSRTHQMRSRCFRAERPYLRRHTGKKDPDAAPVAARRFRSDG